MQAPNFNRNISINFVTSINLTVVDGDSNGNYNKLGLKVEIFFDLGDKIQSLVIANTVDLIAKDIVARESSTKGVMDV